MRVIKQAPAYIGPHNYCAGCGHGIFVRLIHEVMEEKGLIENNVCLIGSGCSSNLKGFIKGSNKTEVHHGRAPHVALGMKKILKDTFIWTYQGDGDAYSIGLGETIGTAHAGHPITVFVINNTNYGMTGGQAARTTLPGQITTTTPYGNPNVALDIMPMLSSLDRVGYLARGTTASAAEIAKLKGYISNAVDCQMNEHKYSLVEILCPCPTNWHKTLPESIDWIFDDAVKHFPLGVFKSVKGE